MRSLSRSDGGVRSRRTWSPQMLTERIIYNADQTSHVADAAAHEIAETPSDSVSRSDARARPKIEQRQRSFSRARGELETHPPGKRPDPAESGFRGRDGSDVRLVVRARRNESITFQLGDVVLVLECHFGRLVCWH